MQPPDEAGRVEFRIEVEAEHPKRHGCRRMVHWDELAPGAIVAYAVQRVLPEGRCPVTQPRNRRGRSPRGGVPWSRPTFLLASVILPIPRPSLMTRYAFSSYVVLGGAAVFAPSCASAEAYFGCATVRRYGFSVLKPCGYFFLASSSDTDVGMMTSWPGFQFTGVATVCLAVNWQESRRRSTSSKLRPVLIGYTIIALTFLSGPTMNTERTVALSTAVRLPPVALGWIMS